MTFLNDIDLCTFQRCEKRLGRLALNDRLWEALYKARFTANSSKHPTWKAAYVFQAQVERQLEGTVKHNH